MPDAVPATAVDDAEQILVGHAARFEPRQLAVIGRRLVDTIDPDGTLADDAEQHRRRELRLCQRSDGSFDLHGRLTCECGVIWQTILTAVAAPGGDGADSGTSSVPVTTPQRLHDGFWQAGKRLLNSSLPAAGGVPTTILLTMTIDQLETRAGVVTSAHGGTLTVEQAVRLGVDANVIPVIFTDTGGIHSYGRKRRFATVGQTYAMYARDLRCTFPGCDQPAALVRTRPRTGLDRRRRNRSRPDAPDLPAAQPAETTGRLATDRAQRRAAVDTTRWIDPHQRPQTNPQPERINLRR